MLTSHSALAPLVAALSREATARGLSDSAWARAAGIPRESLSRLRRRGDCNLSTLTRLAGALEHDWQLTPRVQQALSEDGHFPSPYSRDLEERLLQLCASGDLAPERWRRVGPAFFMAGLAVLLAGSNLCPRRPYLELAEQLHPGSTEPACFGRWLARSPVQAVRFLPQFEQALSHAAD
jgi:DNA-binding phage protein